MKQYREDRPATNLPLGRRAFVHFAMDGADFRSRTTHLAMRVLYDRYRGRRRERYACF